MGEKERKVVDWMDTDFLERESDAVKGENGKVGVLGGNKKYISTPTIVGIGASRSGSDLVKIISNRDSNRAAAFSQKSFLTADIGSFSMENLDDILAEVEGCTSIVVGNGTTKDEDIRETLLEVLKRTEMPAVIDADMLVQDLTKIDFSDRKVVLTPHEKEFERLYEKVEGYLAAIKEKVKKAARIYDATVVLKRDYDIISDGNTVFTNFTGTPHLAKGGTGDILAGMTGYLVSKTKPLKACCLATYVLGKAGEKVHQVKGPGFNLEELGEQVSVQMKEF